MAEDEFSKTSGKALEHAAAGTAGAAGALVAGPGGAIAGVVLVRSATDWFKRRTDKNDDALYDARLSAVEDEFRQLAERMRKLEEERATEGKKLDREDFLSREAVYSEFAKGVTEAPTPEKRLALINATSKQFDPDAGLPSVREYWLRRVRALPDIELEVVRLLHEHGRLAFDGAIFAVPKSYMGGTPNAMPLGKPTRSEVVALEVVALEMSKGSDPSQLLNRQHGQIMKPVGESRENFTTSIIGLTPSGEELAKFIAD